MRLRNRAKSKALPRNESSCVYTSLNGTKSFKAMENICYVCSVAVIVLTLILCTAYNVKMTTTMPNAVDVIFESTSNSYIDHMHAVLKGCGDICRTDMTGVPSLFHDYIEKEVDCKSLLSNPFIDAQMGDSEPPKHIPDEMLEAFSYNGQVLIIPHEDLTMNQRYMGVDALTVSWTEVMIDEMAKECQAGEGPYNVDAIKQLAAGLKQTKIKNPSVLVIGSESPRVEACVLAYGAREVTSISYGAINSTHPQVHILTPGQARVNHVHFLDKFDVVLTYASVEHSGLGRYGDAMNPWGDRQAIARAWCLTKKDGYLVLIVPFGSDKIEYNAHRIYGPIQLPHLAANWRQIWKLEGLIMVYQK